MGLRPAAQRKDPLLLFKSRITAAVDAKTQKAAFFQQSETLPDCFQTGISSGCQGVIPSGKIAQVESNAAYRFGVSILFHMAVGIQDQTIIVWNTGCLQPFLCLQKGCVLDIKSQNMAFFSDKLT